MRHLITFLLLGLALSSATARHCSAALVDGDPLASVPPQTLDASFQFRDPLITNIFDLELFPNGTIAYGGEQGRIMGSNNVYIGYNSIGRAEVDGTMLNSGGGLLSAAYSLAVDLDGAIVGGGESAGLSEIARVAGREDYDFRWRNDFSGTVRKVLMTRRGDILIGGSFTVGRDLFTRYGLVRLDSTGVRDAVFAHTNSLGLDVIAAALTADGRILGAYRGTNETGFGRWLSNGERDLTYDGTWGATWGTNTDVTVVEKAPGTNGFVAAFSRAAGVAGPWRVTQLVRLDETGVPVEWLHPEIHGSVNAIGFEAVRAETVAKKGYDRLIVGGDFTAVGDVDCDKLVSIEKDGTVAWCFSPPEGPETAICAIEVQLDGKVLIGGDFTNIGGIGVRGMARLTGNSGSGQSYLYWADREFRVFEKLGQGVLKLIRGGNTNDVLAVDLSLASGTGETNLPQVPTRIEFRPGDKVAEIPVSIGTNSFREDRRIFGIRLSVQNTNVLVTRGDASLVVMDDETPGTVDPTWNLNVGDNFRVAAIQPDGKSIYGGYGTELLRANVDGSLDPTFITNGLGARTGEVRQIFPLADGKVYVAGKFWGSGPIYGINHLARLNQDGTLDESFDPRLSRNSPGVVIEVLDGGDVVVWLTVRNQIEGGDGMTGLYRLDDTGRIRGKYNGVREWVQGPTALEHLSGGELFAYAGLSYGLSPRLAKFSANGVRDTNFVASIAGGRGIGGGQINDMEVIGEWLWLGGSFETVNSLPAPYLTRVNVSSGVVDTNLSVTLNSDVNTIRVWQDKIYIGGSFTTVNGQRGSRLVRLNLDGSLDETFDAGYGPSLAPGVIEVQADGKLIIGSDLEQVDGVLVPTFARLEGDGPVGFEPVPELIQVRREGEDVSITYGAGRLEAIFASGRKCRPGVGSSGQMRRRGTSFSARSGNDRMMLSFVGEQESG